MHVSQDPQHGGALVHVRHEYIAALPQMPAGPPAWLDYVRNQQGGGRREVPEGATPTLALLGLFEGSGLARLAIDELLTRLQLADRLVQAGFAELEDHLADAVTRYWHVQAGLRRVPP